MFLGNFLATPLKVTNPLVPRQTVLRQKTTCLLICFGIADGINSFHRLHAQLHYGVTKHPVAAHEDATPVHPFSPSKVNSVLIAMHCPNVQSRLFCRWEENSAHLMDS